MATSTGCFLLGLLSCSSDPTSVTQPAPSSTEGSARRIASSGHSFRLGSQDVQSAPEERPGFTRFAHDFWLDTTEVTQAEFLSLTTRSLSPNASQSPTKPVVNVTWFDAVLFCNARSKRDHLDTVYDYSSISSDSSGSTWNLIGLASHLDRHGWRLPTEAEWEYADRAGSSTAYPWGELADSSKATEFAWFQKNAGASLHDVARLKPNAWGFYDLSGNAMEWVQDWKGSFPQDTVTDYVGPDNPGDIPEAPLKSGAYTYGLEHLRPSSRTATYAAYRSARAEYVGFRCARGGFTPTYTNASGQQVQAPPVAILRTDVARLLGAQSARLVFLNRSKGKGLLSWIDYGEATPVVRSLPDKDPVFHPAISPDGQWVAWSTVMEGSTGTSRIKARRLVKNDSVVIDLGAGAIPRWWVNGTDTFLVRASSAMDNTGSGWGTGQTTAERWSHGALTGSVESWSSGGSYHDGRSGSYLYTGYRRLKQFNLNGKTSRTLFTSPQNGKSSGDTSQVCNTSASPDGSGRVMFLDFGYEGNSTVVGRPYRIHEVAFVADSMGKVQKTYPVASGKLQWDDLEWSNHPSWAVGMALENNRASQEVHLLDLSSGNSIPLVHGEDLGMPGLWVGENHSRPMAYSADSLFAYDKPLVSSYQGAVASKLPAFLAQRDSIEIVAVGSSRVYHGIAPEAFSRRAMNLGIDGSDVQLDERILREVVMGRASPLKVVVLGVMTGWLLWSENQGIGAAVVNSTGWIYDANHGFWKNGISKAMDSAARMVDWTNHGILTKSGESIHASVNWGRETPVFVDEANDSLLGMIFARNWGRLQGLVTDLSAAGIHVVLVNFPVSPHYRDSPRAGLWEPYWNTYHEILRRLKLLEQISPKIHFVDANLDGLHDYTDDDALDYSHLATPGAIKLTRRLDSLIQTFALPNQSP